MCDSERFLPTPTPFLASFSPLTRAREKNKGEKKEERSSPVNLEKGDMAGFEPGCWETNTFWFLGQVLHQAAALTSLRLCLTSLSLPASPLHTHTQLDFPLAALRGST